MSERSVDALINRFDEAFSEKELTQLALDIWAHDKWCTWDQWKRGAELCGQSLRDGGIVDAEVIPWRTDEEHGTGLCRMTDTWEVQRGELYLVDTNGPIEKIADHRENPWHLVLRSSHTPEGGVTAEVVCVESAKELEALPNAAVRGKIVLTSTGCREVMRMVLAKGGIGMVSDKPTPDLPDAVGWRKFGMIGWAMDEPRRCWGFSLSENQGNRLRKLAADHPPLRLHALIEGRVGNEHVYGVTGRIPGAVEAEILCNGHLQEPGIVDNASGCAVLVTAMVVLNRLIRDGALPPPRKSLRILLGYEWSGSLTFFDRLRAITDRIRFGLCIDSIGSKPELDREKKAVGLNPPMNAHCTDGFVLDLLERLRTRYGLGEVWAPIPFSGGTDCRQADPSYDIPTVTLMALGGYRGYHSSGDTLEILDPRMLKVHAVLAATYLYHLATADLADARWHLARCAEVARTALRDLKGRVFDEGRPDREDALDIPSMDGTRKAAAMDYLEERECIRVHSLLDLVDDDADRTILSAEVDAVVDELMVLAEEHRRALSPMDQDGIAAECEPSDVARAEALVPTRLVAGDPWAENLSKENKERIRVPGPCTDAVWWANGVRTIYDCWRLSLTEHPKTTLKGVLRYMDALVELGWMELHPAHLAAPPEKG